MDIIKYQFKEVNGVVLRILQQYGFEYVSDSIVAATFKDRQIEWVLHSVQDHFFYLSGKGKEYVEIKESILLDTKQTAARLTPRGIDLLFGVIENDPGISI